MIYETSSKVAENNAAIAKKNEEYFKQKYGTNSTSSLGEESNANSLSAKTTTSRGTKIREYGDNGMDKDSFLKLLVAQMTNLDPTQDQDNTAYVTQMAQFASIEQMNNLNITMTGYSVRNLLGQTAQMNMADEQGNYIQGTVLGSYKKNDKYYLSILNTADGKVYDDLDSSKVVAVVKNSSADTYLSSLNTQFMAASNLKGKYVIDAVVGKDGKTITLTKGKVTGAYLDANGVKLKIDVVDDDLQKTGTAEVSYLELDKMGDLTEDEVKEAKPDDFKYLVDSSESGVKKGKTGSYVYNYVTSSNSTSQSEKESDESQENNTSDESEDNDNSTT